MIWSLCQSIEKRIFRLVVTMWSRSLGRFNHNKFRLSHHEISKWSLPNWIVEFGLELEMFKVLKLCLQARYTHNNNATLILLRRWNKYTMSQINACVEDNLLEELLILLKLEKIKDTKSVRVSIIFCCCIGYRSQ